MLQKISGDLTNGPPIYLDSISFDDNRNKNALKSQKKKKSNKNSSIIINAFHATGLFLYALKTSENQGVSKETSSTSGMKWVNGSNKNPFIDHLSKNNKKSTSKKYQ